jgi:hypothetical protein
MTRFAERPQFFDGQRLFAADLQLVEAFNRQMRWLHNRTLHRPGIGNGFAVTGARGERQVTIGPGYAIDGEGREIVLAAALVEPVPPVAGTKSAPAYFDLTVSYPDDAALADAAAETRQGVCAPRGVVRLREEPVLCWVRLRPCAVEAAAAPVERGLSAGAPGATKPVRGCFDAEDSAMRRDVKEYRRLVLARIAVVDCRTQALDLSPRLSARPTQSPYIACGRAALDDFEADDSVGLHFRGQVDTSHSGFVTAPCYLVRVEGRATGRVADYLDLLPITTTVTQARHDGFAAAIGIPLAGSLLRRWARAAALTEVTSRGSASDRKKFVDEVLAFLINRFEIVWIGIES